MDRQDIAEQTRFEQELLRHVMEGLRHSATWQVREPNASRKLSSLRFVTGSFQRHLERLLALEEYGGFMDKVLDCAPHLGRATEALRPPPEGGAPPQPSGVLRASDASQATQPSVSW